MNEAQRKFRFVNKRISVLDQRMKSRKRRDIAARSETRAELLEAIAERNNLFASYGIMPLIENSACL